MRKLLNLAGVILMMWVSSSANAQTTEEEYNYITKGYKIQIESGLDMKKGYRFEDVDSWGLKYSGFERNASFKMLYRDGEKKPCAILMKLDRTNTTFEAYLCIPHYFSDDQIWKRAYNDFVTIGSNDWTEASRAYTWGMIKMISHLATGE